MDDDSLLGGGGGGSEESKWLPPTASGRAKGVGEGALVTEATRLGMVTMALVGPWERRLLASRLAITDPDIAAADRNGKESDDDDNNDEEVSGEEDEAVAVLPLPLSRRALLTPKLLPKSKDSEQTRFLD